MNNLFASHTGKHMTIVLVDASGSTIAKNFGTDLVFNKEKEIIKNLDEEEYRLIFWNSDNNANNAEQKNSFVKGIFKLPFVVKKDKLDLAFGLVKPNIHQGCLTFPHLGFDGIPDEWICHDGLNKIYFITDGEMGHSNISSYEMSSLKTALKESIKRLFAKYNNIQLHIITVEPKYMDFTLVETLEKAAGCDVYNVIMDNQMTKHITKFISYTTNNLNGFVHINKNIPPPGFIPYADKYFSEMRTGEFLVYLSEVIANTGNEDELLKIVQNLASTVSTLIKDKPAKIVDDIIRTFCRLFKNTTLDIMFAQLILTDAVQKERAGTANVFASYRAKLRDLYKQANELLIKNVKEAIGINEFFISLPLDGKIISGHFRLIDKNLKIYRTNYPQSATEINGIMVPIIPFDYTDFSPMNEQCLRQWVRQLIYKLYGVNVMEDTVIYVVLSIVLQVILSDVDDTIKNSYRQLGTIMLKKKRMNTDITELSRLENGEFPVPNSGKIEVFYGYMNFVKHKLDIDIHPMTFWYALCLALGNQSLITKQLIHCKEYIEKDFAGINPENLLLRFKGKIGNIVHHCIEFENVLDYSCLVTMDDTSKTGGYRFLPHNNIQGSNCCPVYVLSETGHHVLLENPRTSFCPICFAHLDATHFQKVGPKPLSIEQSQIFNENTIDVFASDRPIPKAKIPTINTNTFAKTPIPNKKGSLVIMKGTVGSGKSTYATKIKEHIDIIGGHCYVVGIDKYCKNGLSVSEAVDKIKEELMTIDSIADAKLLVVIIDTCGEKNSGNIHFNVDFTGWPKINVWPNLDRSQLENYLAWSLRNVLLRGNPNPSWGNADSYHHLNPTTAGIGKCMEVHQSKARALYGKKLPKMPVSANMGCEEAIALINDKADAYQKFLSEKMDLDIEIKKVMDKIIH
jgi:hypothetical protein